jgi:hypothetical protein
VHFLPGNQLNDVNTLGLGDVKDGIKELDDEPKAIEDDFQPWKMTSQGKKEPVDTALFSRHYSECTSVRVV